MSATILKERLRADLKAAMQSKATDEVRLLRTLIAALDNAEAVPVEASAHVTPPTGTRAFGDPSGEVARREIDGPALDALLTGEAEARLAAAEDYDRHGREAEASRLRQEAELIARYRA
jgi:uncharacterized protein YqeY